jgi:hypothetical protein
MASRLHSFPLLKAEEIENTPSRQDGVSAAKEARLWKKIGSVIYETAKMVDPPMCVFCFLKLLLSLIVLILPYHTKSVPPPSSV